MTVSKYNLHYIWDRVLFNTQNLELIDIMDINTEHSSVAMLRPSHLIDIGIEE